MAALGLLCFKVLQLHSAPSAQAVPRLFNAPQEPRVMLEAVVVPILLRFEADQYTCRFAMTRDDDLLRFRLAKITGQVVLDLGEGHFLHSGFAHRASHDSASDLATIAKISTVAPETS